MADEHFEKILAEQLALNKETWQQLHGLYLGDNTKVRLKFSFHAPDKESAEVLKALVQDQTDYVVRTKRTGFPFRKEWRVEGSTLEMTTSAAAMEQWVKWMVGIGHQRKCDFDGWRLEVVL